MEKSKEFQNLILKTIKSIEQIWDQIGATEQEKREKKSEFFQELKSFLSNAHSNANQLLKNAQKHLENVQNQCKDLRFRLGEENIKNQDNLNSQEETKGENIKEKLNHYEVIRDRLVIKEKQLKILLKNHFKNYKNLEEKLRENGIYIPLDDAESLKMKEISKDALVFILEKIKVSEEKLEKHWIKVAFVQKNVAKLKEELGICMDEIDFEVLNLNKGNKGKEKENDLKTLLVLKDELVKIKEQREKERMELVGKVRDLKAKTSSGPLLEMAEKTISQKPCLKLPSLETLRKTVEELHMQFVTATQKESIERIKIILNLYEKLSVTAEKRKIKEEILKKSSFNLTEQDTIKIASEENRVKNLDKNKTLLESLAAKRQKIIIDGQSMDDKDPNRFRIPGRLIQEEKMRARIRTLPRFSKIIKKLIAILEEGTGTPFVWKGEILKESLEAFERKEKEEKEKERSAVEIRRNERKRRLSSEWKIEKTPVKRIGKIYPKSVVGVRKKLFKKGRQRKHMGVADKENRIVKPKK